MYRAVEQRGETIRHISPVNKSLVETPRTTNSLRWSV